MQAGLRVALVTGAGHGIGLAVARRLAAEGWGVVGADRTAVGEEPGIRPVQADVSDEAAVASLVGGIAAQEGRLDAVVSNAGFMIRKPLQDVTFKERSSVMKTNLSATYLLVRVSGTLPAIGAGEPPALPPVSPHSPTKPARSISGLSF